jgi:hypothetical protein
MQKLLVGLALSLVVTAVSAQWLLVAEGVNGVKHYVDPATKKRTGSVVRIWGITDNGKSLVVGGKAYRSDRNYWQYDCAARTGQYLQATLFTGKMATGEIVASLSNPGNKQFIAPDSVAGDLLNFACK